MINPTSLFTRLYLLWVCEVSRLHRRLNYDVIREICGYLQEMQKLISVRKDSVECFDLATRQWQHLITLREHIDAGRLTSATLVSTHQIFICGCGSYPCECHTGKNAYMVEGNGTVRQLPDMLQGRQAHGILWDAVLEAVYVFGGCEDDVTCFFNEKTRMCHAALQCSEQFRHGKWELLPDMCQARSLFNPCWHFALVYLCGGGSVSMETYDPRSNAFTLLSFSLPEDGECIAVAESDVLTIVTGIYICKVQRGRIINKIHRRHYIWSTCTPIIRGGVAYVVDLGCCCGIDLETGTVVMEVNIL